MSNDKYDLLPATYFWCRMLTLTSFYKTYSDDIIKIWFLECQLCVSMDTYLRMFDCIIYKALLIIYLWTYD